MPSTRTLATGLSGLLGVGITLIGTRFVVDPEGAARGFGVAASAGGDAGAYLTVKGVRDIASGLVALTLLATGHRRALGWAMVAQAFTPAADTAIVLAHGGGAATAFGIHAATAATVALAGGLLLRDTGPAAAPTAPGRAAG